MINIIAPINQLGYGVAGLNIVKALSKISSVALWTIGQAQITTQEDANICKEAIEMSSIYQEGGTTGRGFIGLAALIFGNWRPGGILAAALLFGYPYALQFGDFDGYASHALLLVNAIALFGVTIWAIRKNKTADAAIAFVLGALSATWYFSSDTVPDWWVKILPYVIVIVVLIFFAQRLRMPEANGQIYRKGQT